MTYDPTTYWPARYLEQGKTYVARGGSADSYEEQLEAVAPMFRVMHGPGRVLDFGCGPGRFREALEARGLTYEGFDLIRSLGTVTELADDRYHFAVAIYVLQHIVDAGEYADALVRLYVTLRVGGRLLVVDHDPMTKPAAHMLPRGPAELVRLFAQSVWHPLGDGHWAGIFTK